MSKEKRFVIQIDPLEIEDDAIYDNKELRLYECQSDMMSDICSLLNKQDKQLADLEVKLAIAEKALELACDKIADMLAQTGGGAWFYDFDGDTVIERDGFEDFYKRYAKEMLKNE